MNTFPDLGTAWNRKMKNGKKLELLWKCKGSAGAAGSLVVRNIIWPNKQLSCENNRINPKFRGPVLRYFCSYFPF